MALIHFLLIYDVRQQRLVSSDQFADPGEATAAYAQAESRHRLSKDYEIVLVGADSLETIRRTHGHYFGDRDLERSPYLVGV